MRPHCVFRTLSRETNNHILTDAWGFVDFGSPAERDCGFTSKATSWRSTLASVPANSFTLTQGSPTSRAPFRPGFGSNRATCKNNSHDYLESVAWEKIVRKSLINIAFTRIHFCPFELAGIIFARCSLLAANRPARGCLPAADTRWQERAVRVGGKAFCSLVSAGGKAFEEPFDSAALGCGGATHTNPVPFMTYRLVATGSPEKSRGQGN